VSAGSALVPWKLTWWLVLSRRMRAATSVGSSSASMRMPTARWRRLIMRLLRLRAMRRAKNPKSRWRPPAPAAVKLL